MQNKQMAHSFVCTFMLSPRLRFSVVRRAKRETRKCPRAWLVARDERGTWLNLKKKRDCSQSMLSPRIVQYKHRLECSVSWCVMHMKYCKYEHRTCYCIQKGLGLGLGLATELASLLAKYFTSYRKSSIKPLGGLIYFQQQQQQQKF